jgi:hypothetical protein
MRMHVDRLDPLSIHGDWQFLALVWLAMRAPRQAAPAKDDPGRSSSRARLQKVAARGRDGFFQRVSPKFFFAGKSPRHPARAVLAITAS